MALDYNIDEDWIPGTPEPAVTPTRIRSAEHFLNAIHSKRTWVAQLPELNDDPQFQAKMESAINRAFSRKSASPGPAVTPR